MDVATPRRITPRILAEAIAGTHPRWWERRMSLLRRVGLVHRVGRYHLGRLDEIAAAVMAGKLDDGEVGE